MSQAVYTPALIFGPTAHTAVPIDEVLRILLGDVTDDAYSQVQASGVIKAANGAISLGDESGTQAYIDASGAVGSFDGTHTAFLTDGTDAGYFQNSETGDDVSMCGDSYAINVYAGDVNFPYNVYAGYLHGNGANVTNVSISYRQSSDPGAVGAGNTWLRESAGGPDGYGCGLFIRDETNSYWLPVSPVAYDDMGNVRAFATLSTAGDIALESKQADGFLTAYLFLYGANGEVYLVHDNESNGALYSSLELEDGYAAIYANEIEFSGGAVDVTDSILSLDAGYDIRFNGPSDPNWRIGVDLSVLETQIVGDDSVLSIIMGAGSGGPDGFAIGNTNGDSYFEIRGDTGDTYMHGNVLIGASVDNNNGVLQVYGDAYVSEALISDGGNILTDGFGDISITGGYPNQGQVVLINDETSAYSISLCDSSYALNVTSGPTSLDNAAIQTDSVGTVYSQASRVQGGTQPGWGLADDAGMELFCEGDAGAFVQCYDRGSNDYVPLTLSASHINVDADLVIGLNSITDGNGDSLSFITNPSPVAGGSDYLLQLSPGLGLGRSGPYIDYVDPTGGATVYYVNGNGGFYISAANWIADGLQIGAQIITANGVCSVLQALDGPTQDATGLGFSGTAGGGSAIDAVIAASGQTTDIRQEVGQDGSTCSGINCDCVEYGSTGTQFPSQSSAYSGASGYPGLVQNINDLLSITYDGSSWQPVVTSNPVVGLTTQEAAISATNLIASIPASGLYRVSFYAKVTRAATLTSTLGGSGGFQIQYTDADDSVVVTTGLIANQSGATLTGNTTQDIYCGSIDVNCLAATALKYSFGYTSTGTTAMQYSLHVRVEAI